MNILLRLNSFEIRSRWFTICYSDDNIRGCFHRKFTRFFVFHYSDAVCDKATSKNGSVRIPPTECCENESPHGVKIHIVVVVKRFQSYQSYTPSRRIRLWRGISGLLPPQLQIIQFLHCNQAVLRLTHYPTWRTGISTVVFEHNDSPFSSELIKKKKYFIWIFLENYYKTYSPVFQYYFHWLPLRVQMH